MLQNQQSPEHGISGIAANFSRFRTKLIDSGGVVLIKGFRDFSYRDIWGPRLKLQSWEIGEVKFSYERWKSCFFMIRSAVSSTLLP